MGDMLLSGLALFNARPTLRVDGQQHDRIDRLLRSMVMSEQEGGLSSLRVTFENWNSREGGQPPGPAFEDEAILQLGTELKVYGGEVGAPTELFLGRVSAVELAAEDQGTPQLTVYAEDGLAKSRLVRHIDVYPDKTVKQLVEAVAGRANLTPRVTGLEDLTDTWFQCNESDLAFLRRILRRFGADAQVVGRDLQVLPREQMHRNDIQLTFKDSLHRFRVVADLAHQATEVKVTGFDPLVGQAVAGTGSSAPLGPGRGRSGKSELQRVFQTRDEQMSHQLALSQTEADALAKANFAARARGFVRVEGVCRGNPDVRVGTHLALANLSPRFDNTYYVTACEHRFDVMHGFETSFTAESAYLGNP